MVRDLEAFRAWLTRCGAEVLAPTSTWEVLRFRTYEGVFVIHRNRKNRQTGWAAVSSLVDLYIDGGNPRLSPKAGERRSSRLRQRYPVLVARDGSGCFYCRKHVPKPGEPCASGYEPTVEHLVPVAHGGPNHLSNAFLAHGRCNNIAGNLSAVEKITLREKMRNIDD